MTNFDEPGGTVRGMPAGTVLTPSGTLMGVADTLGDVAPPDPEDDAEVSGDAVAGEAGEIPSSLIDESGIEESARRAAEPPTES